MYIYKAPKSDKPVLRDILTLKTVQTSQQSDVPSIEADHVKGL